MKAGVLLKTLPPRISTSVCYKCPYCGQEDWGTMYKERSLIVSCDKCEKGFIVKLNEKFYGLK